jgi:hypothetical protein
MRLAHHAARTILGLTVAAAAACSSATGPGQTDVLEGRWEGISATGVAYVYDFSAAGEESVNPRTGNSAPTYSLAYTTTPGGSGSITAWYEGQKAYWGGSSVGTITGPNTMTVEAQTVAPFTMHRQP